MNVFKSALITGTISWLILAAILWLIIGCDDDCTEYSTRCHNNTIQRCVNGDWLYEMGCDKVTLLDGTQQPGECCGDRCTLKGHCNE